MSSQGPLTAGTGADDASVGSVAWTSPGNITASDDTRATTTALNAPTSTHYLFATNFGFSIPAGATITGVVVETEASFTGSGAAGIADKRMYLLKAGALEGSDHVPTGTTWTTTEAFLSVGGSSDMWGATLSPSDVNNSGFGVALSVEATSVMDAATPRVDSIRMTVHYTEASVLGGTLTMMGV